MTSKPLTLKVVAVVLALSCCGLIIVGILYGTSPAMTDAPPQPLDWGIIIDAGSSHSSIYLFHWPQRVNKSQPFVTLNPVAANGADSNYSPIGSFLAHPQNAGESLKGLLDYALKNIPASSLNTTTIRLGATAGMRDATLANATAAALIMESVRDFIQTYPFEFNRTWAKIITGTDEGMFGWLTANYASGFVRDPATGPEYGAMDMGGASTQLTFVVPPSELVQPDTFRTCVIDMCYNLYSHSYLGFGTNRIKAARQARLTPGPSGNVTDPCLNLGYSKLLSGTSYLIGGGDAAGCLTEFISLMNKSACASPSDCGINGVYQPPVPPATTMLGFSGFVYPIIGMASNTAIFNLTMTPTIEEIRQNAAVLCALPYSSLPAVMPNDTIKFIVDYCGTANYMVTLFTTGYNMPNTRRVKFASDVNGISMGWALGALLTHENLIPIDTSPFSGSPTRNIPDAAAYALFPILSVIILVSVGALVVVTLMARRMADGMLVRSETQESSQL